MRVKSILLAASLLASVTLAGCTTTGGSTSPLSAYSQVNDGGFVVPALKANEIKPEFRRQIVAYPTDEKPGTIIIDTEAKFLYYIMPDGKAMRYGIGVGRDGFRWSGNATIGRKAKWPAWVPPQRMLVRQPELKEFAGGMGPGLKNPLGARALYLYKDGKDSMFRLHGTPEWWTIGTNVSSGCIRLINQDIIDLYNRAEIGAKVIVK
ncbi:L,D-transpeptidase [uncultured Bartonella sp.]|uniref:L,D-transpeptidase n=1 Tax=uncultured Bartonella sp. TaxID=104108 RepID=UPI0025E163D2|nr:L,D-transpeptidase [uncultured Bartonella sp.]